ARNLNALLQICRAIGSLRDEESLPWQLLSMIFELIPAERGAILLTEDDSNEIRSEVTWDRVFGPEHPVHISGEIVSRVIGEGISLLDGGTLTQNPAEKPTENPIARNLAGSAAADENRQRTFLCVPMISEK